MSDKFIQPDMLIPVQTYDGGTANLHPGYDTIHYFPQVAGFLLKFTDFDNEGQLVIKDCVLSRNAAGLLVASGIGVAQRFFITESEHQAMITSGASLLDAEEMDLGIDVAAIEAEEQGSD